MAQIHDAFTQSTNPKFGNNKLIIQSAREWAQTNGSDAKGILKEFGPFLSDLRALALKSKQGKKLNKFETVQLQVARQLLRQGEKPQTIRTESYIQAKKANGGEIPTPEWLVTTKRQKAQNLAQKSS